MSAESRWSGLDPAFFDEQFAVQQARAGCPAERVVSETVVFEPAGGFADATDGDRHPVVAVPIKPWLWPVGLVVAEDVNQLVGGTRQVDPGE